MRAALHAEKEPVSIDVAAEVINAIADGLRSYGLDVRGPKLEGWHYLEIADTPARPCEVSICDGTAQWEYRPLHEPPADPARITGIALKLLGAGTTDCGTLPVDPGLTLKSAAGRALVRCGMQVSLEIICKDEAFFEVYSEIEVVNPGQPSRGRVWIADDSTIRWQCDLDYPGGDTTGMAPAGIAAAIATALAIQGEEETAGHR